MHAAEAPCPPAFPRRYYNVNEFAFVTFLYGHALIPSPAFDAAHHRDLHAAAQPRRRCEAATRRPLLG